MSVATFSALAGAVSFAALMLWTLWRGPFNREAQIVVVACAIASAWALALLTDGFGLKGTIALLESAQCLAWIVFLELLLAPSMARRLDPRFRFLARFAAVGAGAAVLLNDLSYLGGPGILATSQVIGREAMAIIGLLLIENLYRNTEEKRLWNVVPLCIGLGGFFAYRLFLYSDALLFGRMSEIFAEARPAIDSLIVPFLALTLARNRNWRLHIHVSHRVALHVLTLVASGVFLVGVVGVATLLRDTGGWWQVVEIAALFGSLLVLATIVSSGSAKARLKYLVSRNFFALRYDYRDEWMRFIDRLSGRGEGEDLKQRVIQGVAAIVDSPAGALWLLSEDGGAQPVYAPASLWNKTHLPPGTVEPANSAFVRGFRDGAWIQEFHKGRAYPTLGDCWLAVPLSAQGRMIGFITLAPSRAPADLNWESFELLRALARQAASYVAEERLARQLVDSRRLQDYAKRFAFVAHDVKNLAGQLRLLVVNAKRHGDDPAFRADAFGTIENAVARLNDLLQQLRANQVAEDAAMPAIDPAPVIRAAVDRPRADGTPIHATLECHAATVRIDSERLGSALTHLLDNAVEASPRGTAISLAAYRQADRLVIDIADEGDGMDVAFIHEQLFRPFRSTKTDGYGIGAYQTREWVREAGGDLEVISAPGAGTTMRIVLPLAKEGAVSSAA
jgi:putative PEP-CTERM system histidine kinase